MKKQDRTTREYRVDLDSDAVRRSRLVRAASAGGIMLALFVIWWMSSPDDAPDEPVPPPVSLPEPAVEPAPADEREVARVELPTLTPPSVADDSEDGTVDDATVAAVEPKVGAGDPVEEERAGSSGNAAEQSEGAPATLPDADADGRYSVEMAEFVALDTVRQAEQAAEVHGVPVRMLRRVVAGPFETRAAADAAIERVRTAHALNGLLIGSEAGGWRVQFGVFGAAANAEALQAKLRAEGLAVTVDARLLLGPYANREEADTVRARLAEGAGLDGLRVQDTQ